MSVKVTTKDSKVKDSFHYPKLMQHREDKTLVVLFCNNCCGTVIRSLYETMGTGYYSSNWRLNEFVSFDEPITIENN